MYVCRADADQSIERPLVASVSPSPDSDTRLPPKITACPSSTKVVWHFNIAQDEDAYEDVAEDEFFFPRRFCGADSDLEDSLPSTPRRGTVRSCSSATGTPEKQLPANDSFQIVLAHSIGPAQPTPEKSELSLEHDLETTGKVLTGKPTAHSVEPKPTPELPEHTPEHPHVTEGTATGPTPAAQKTRNKKKPPKAKPPREGWERRSLPRGELWTPIKIAVRKLYEGRRVFHQYLVHVYFIVPDASQGIFGLHQHKICQRVQLPKAIVQFLLDFLELSGHIFAVGEGTHYIALDKDKDLREVSLSASTAPEACIKDFFTTLDSA